MKKKVLYLLLLIIVAVTGCALLEPEEKTFKDKVMSITLTDEFTEKDLVSATVYFESMDAIVTGLKEEFSTLEAAGLTKDSTVEDYAKAVTTNNQKDSEIKTEDGLTYFTYTSDVNGKHISISLQCIKVMMPSGYLILHVIVAIKKNLKAHLKHGQNQYHLSKNINCSSFLFMI